MAVPVRSLADLRRCRINTTLLADIYTRHGATGCHAFSRETVEVGASRAHARFFAPADNIAEDPATGSACGALGGYLVTLYKPAPAPAAGGGAAAAGVAAQPQ